MKERRWKALAEGRSCEQDSANNLSQLFLWTDLPALKDLMNGDQSANEINLNLRSLLKSTALPEVESHAQSAFALHPVLGLRHFEKIPPMVEKSLLNLVLEFAYTRTNYMTEESCRAALPPLVLASILGLKIESSDSTLDAKNAKERWLNWLRLRLTAFAATTAGLKNCQTMLPFIENLTQSAIGFPNLNALLQLGSYYNGERFSVGEVGNPERWNLHVSRSLKVVDKKTKIRGIKKAR